PGTARASWSGNNSVRMLRIIASASARGVVTARLYSEGRGHDACARRAGVARARPADRHSLAVHDLEAIVRGSYEAFARGDLDRALSMMDEEIVWHQAQGLPHGGVYHGLAAVRAAVFDPLDEEWWDEFDATPSE